MLEYLPCNLRQETKGYFLGTVQQLYKLPTIIRGETYLVKPFRTALALRSETINIPCHLSRLGIDHEVLRMLQADGLEYSADDQVRGSGIRNLAFYFDREGSEKDYFPPESST